MDIFLPEAAVWVRRQIQTMSTVKMAMSAVMGEISLEGVEEGRQTVMNCICEGLIEKRGI